MHEAKTQLSRLVEMALAGEEVVIARRQQPLVRLEVLKPSQRRRRVGQMSGLIEHMPDDFNDPLDDWPESVVPQ